MQGKTIELKLIPEMNQDRPRYSIRLCQPNDKEEDFFWVTLAYGGTRLETYEYDNREKALSDYRLMCQTIKTVMECERGK